MNPVQLPEHRIETRRVADLVPADYNPRKISPKAMEGLKKSLAEFGAVQPIVVNERTGHIVGGHQRVKALAALGQVETTVIVVDLSLTREKALNVALNNPHISGEFDDGLGDLLDEINGEMPELFADLRLDELLAPAEAEPEKKGTDGTYTRKIQIPIYEPKGAKPAVADLFDTAKTSQLVQRINESSAPDEVKRFLRLAAERHTIFHFGRIAEYYCHADADVQDLFEQSALVIIDYQKAVENGFVAFTEAMFKIADVEGESDAG